MPSVNLAQLLAQVATLPQTQADWQQFINVLQQWANTITPQGVYQAAFGSGYLQYSGPSGVTGNINFEVGTNLPNPSGTPGPALLLGSGATPVTFAIIQDQAYTPAQAGNNLIITAGETQGSGTANGGYLLVIGGGSYGGTGGTTTLQGGTSANGTGGEAILAGGNATNGGVPGDAFVIGGAGTAPGSGANVHLVATNINGVAGDVRIRTNSTILYQFLSHGEIYATASGTGAGLAGQPLVSGGVGASAKWASGNFTGVITTAKLTTSGANGSMTFSSGILISETAAT